MGGRGKGRVLGAMDEMRARAAGSKRSDRPRLRLLDRALGAVNAHFMKVRPGRNFPPGSPPATLRLRVSAVGRDVSGRNVQIPRLFFSKTGRPGKRCLRKG